MSRRTGNMLKGIMLGMAVGAVAYVISSDSMKRTRKSMKRSAMKAVRNARDLIDGVSEIMR